jgi:hypothetical protein
MINLTDEEFEAIARDAKRYQWLRDEANEDSDLCPFYCGDGLDAAIDAAMQEQARTAGLPLSGSGGNVGRTGAQARGSAP